MGINFGLISSKEFEEVCKDVLEKRLGTPLRFYGLGADGGRDITSEDGSNSVIVQCKHYVKSSPEALYRSLEKGLNQAINLHPLKYYLCISSELTPPQIKKIQALYKDIIPDDSFIIDGSRLGDWLSLPEYGDIVRKHLPLFIANQNVLAAFLTQDISEDTESLLTEIAGEGDVYVKNEWFPKALELLASKRMLLLTGDPGIGKTTLSKMLIMEFLRQKPNAKLIYASDGNIRSMKKAMNPSGSQIELFFLDDFVGKFVMDLGANQISEITSFIENISQHQNRYIIINSRITVLNKTQNAFASLEKKLEKTGCCLLEINSLSMRSKAKIFVNHIIKGNVDQERIDSLLADNRYFDVVNHPNYNPRLIEFVTNKKHYESREAKDYYKFIMEILDKPSVIWQTEYEALTDYERLLLIALGSFPDCRAPDSVLKECAARMSIVCPNKQGQTPDSFEVALAHLSGSFIKRTATRSAVINQFANPAVEQLIAQNTSLNFTQTELYKSVVWRDQLFRIFKDYPKTQLFKEDYESGKLFGLDTGEVRDSVLHLLYFSQYRGGDIYNLATVLKELPLWHLNDKPPYTNQTYRNLLIRIKNNVDIWQRLIGWIGDNPDYASPILAKYVMILDNDESSEFLSSDWDSSFDVDDLNDLYIDVLDAIIKQSDFDDEIEEGIADGHSEDSIIESILDEIDYKIRQTPFIQSWENHYGEYFDPCDYTSNNSKLRNRIITTIQEKRENSFDETIKLETEEYVTSWKAERDFVIRLFSQLRSENL